MLGKLIFLYALLFLINKVPGQVSPVALAIIPSNTLRPEITDDYFEYSNIDDTTIYVSKQYDLRYYVRQGSKMCGYFEGGYQKLEVDESINSHICNLDPLSFIIYTLNLNNMEYIILESIADVSGTGTRRVFLFIFQFVRYKCSLFKQISIYYGSIYNIGDFNNDGLLDYFDLIKIDDKKYQTKCYTLIDGKFLESLALDTYLVDIDYDTYGNITIKKSLVKD